MSLTGRTLGGVAWLHRRAWWLRACTLGVRAIVLDGDGVLLVRHTYLPGWYLPGGGVDRGESAEAAVIRELQEEGGISCRERPRLHGFYRNGRRDHVACYRVDRFERERDGEHSPFVREIAEAAFFSLSALPPGVTDATRRRLDEIARGTAPSADW